MDFEKILVDKASGKDLNRASYQELKGALGLREGITSLDRLSRNKEELKQEFQWFRDNKIRLKALDLPTSLIEIPEGQQWILEMIQNILIEVLASIAEQERLTIRKRQWEGIDAARKKGKHLGRPRITQPDDFVEVYYQWKAGKITAKEAMRMLKMKSSTFYRMVKVYEEKSMSKGM